MTVETERWQIAAADLTEDRHRLRQQLADAHARINHLERLIVTFAEADAEWFRVSGDITSHCAARLHAAEVALRDEADHIRYPPEDRHVA